jgi:hypothetical protein
MRANRGISHDPEKETKDVNKGAIQHFRERTEDLCK